MKKAMYRLSKIGGEPQDALISFNLKRNRNEILKRTSKNYISIYYNDTIADPNP